jgi:pimeloyl-ACP methyl ester carboxylesterase
MPGARIRHNRRLENAMNDRREIRQLIRTSRETLVLVVLAVAVPAIAQDSSTPLTIAKQGSFFVGGRDVHSDTLSTSPNFPASGTITVDQMYVRYQIPTGATAEPIALIHGCCLTGKTWETTPDGRMGWDEYFLRKGRSVYVVDQVARGRSAADPSAIVGAKLAKSPADRLPSILSASHEAAWTVFRFGPEYGKAYPNMQFPIDAAPELWKQMVVDWARSLATPNPTVAAVSQLARQIGKAVLVSHSQSGIYPFQEAVMSTDAIAAIVSIEPAECPDANGDLASYLKIPILVLWGDYVDLSERWAPRLKSCRAFADAVNARGGKADNVELPKVGIHGNSHMLMQDKNNLQVAEWVLAWTGRQLNRARRQ